MQCTEAYSSCRNQLKHIQKIRYVTDEADQYERAWLLLADIYIQSGKFDLAQVWLLISNVYEGLLGLSFLGFTCLQQTTAACNTYNFSDYTLPNRVDTGSATCN